MMHGRKELSPNRQMALARFDAKANAAKVEVTKAVLDEVEKALRFMHNEYVRDSGHSYPEGEQTLTLIKQLKEVLDGRF